MPARRPPHVALGPALLLLALATRARASSSPASGDYDCARHDPRASQTNGRGCLARLASPAAARDYDECRDPRATTTCYIFLQEPPFVTLKTVANWNNTADALALQRPFRCGSFAAQFRPEGGIDGIAMRLHNLTVSADDLCMWGGHADDCKFNQLVDYTQLKAADGYRFAVTGLLLELPQRQCAHHASAPFVDNSMIIIGERKAGSVSNGPLHQLTRPFHRGTWAIFGGVLLTFIIVCVAIAVRFHVFRGRSLLTAFFIFTGERDGALAHERLRHGGDASQALSYAAKYGLSMSLYRLAVLGFIGIFVLFYEVAVVNFLFQQQNIALTKSVQSLTVGELTHYSVLKDSALENVWNATVNARRLDTFDGDTIPWQRCPTATDCIVAASKGETRFVVTFEIVGKYLLLQESSCDELAIFETQDTLYQFNAGWLYNDNVDEEKRKQVDRQLVGMRIDGTTRVLIDQQLADFSCENSVTPDIGPMIVLIPVLIFVFPPLSGSVLSLLLWKRGKRGDTSHEAAESPSDSKTLEGESSSSI